jgi:chaperonin GroEL
MPKKLLYGDDARATLARGVEKLARAVAATLGPRGGNAIIDRPLGTPLVSRDGVSIAEEIELEDKFENMGAQIVREVAKQTNEMAGDGTTTAVVLANALIQSGLLALGRSGNTVLLFDGMDRAAHAAMQHLSSRATRVRSDSQLQAYAAISAGEPVLGQAIAEAVRSTGRDGTVHFEADAGGRTALKLLTGFSIDRGYLSAHKSNRPDRKEAVLDHPLILLTDHGLDQPAEIDGALRIAEQAKRPLLILAEQVAPGVIGHLLLRGKQSAIDIVAVHAPEYGHWRKAVLEDIAILTGGRYLSKELGDRLEAAEAKDLGGAHDVRVTLDSTTFTGGEGNPETIEARRSQIRAQIQGTAQPVERDKLEERLARMAGAAAVLYVGGSTPADQKRRLQMAEDSLNAVRAAIDGGIVAGGGTALAYVAGELESLLAASPEEMRAGIRSVQAALRQPLISIAHNCGVDSRELLEQVARADYGFGLNARTCQFGDLIAQDVLDPFQVTAAALENAVSVAKLVLGAQTLIVDSSEAADSTSGPARGGGAERYGLDYVIEESSP